MKFTPTKFYAAFADGLLEVSGHAFSAIDRTFVVHMKRVPICEWDKTYAVSDSETGTGFPISPTRNRVTAAHLAIEVLKNIPPEQRTVIFQNAAAVKARLPYIKVDK